MRLTKMPKGRHDRAGRLIMARPVPGVSEPLERRTLLSATLTAGIDSIQLAPGTNSTPINLDQHFTDPAITGIAAVIDTTQGLIPLNLFSQQAPQTVNNFVQYAINKSYDNTVIQRAVPGFLLQGGGFLSDESHIPTAAPIPNEFSLSNTLGTISAALTTDPVTRQVDPNSATSDWFINDGNNTSLDAQKFTVFGQVIYNGMQVVDQIETLPKGSVSPTFVANVNAGDPVGGVLPLQNFNVGSPIRVTNYVLTSTIVTVNPLLYTVTSDNSSVVTGSVSGTNLTLAAGQTNGVAHVTVTAGDLGGNTINTVFTVQVGQTQVTLGKGLSKLVKFTDADGTAGQISLSGAGTATVSFGGLGLTSTPAKGGIVTIGGTPAGITIAVASSGASSTLTITGKGGNGVVDLTGITSDGSMRAINGRNTALAGSLGAGGSIASIVLSSITGGNVNLGAGPATAINIGTVTNAGIFAVGAIKSVTANSWSTPGAISGTAVGKIAIKGVFIGNVNAASVQSITAGSIAGGSWNVSGNVASVTTQSISTLTALVGSFGKLNVKAAFDASALRSTGNIASVSVGNLTDSMIFAGVGSANLPSQAGDFAADSSIKSVKLKTLVNSSIAAKTLGTINLGSATPVNNGSPFGLAAHQIKSLTATIGGKALKLKNVTTADQVTAAYAAAGISSSDPEVRIL